ncbi:hypothetical protein ACWDSD_16305 [Streptomyces spiralis]
MPQLTAKLSHQQHMLMQTMVEPFLETGQWPVWHYIATKLDRNGLDAEELLKSLPVVGVREVGRWSYGLAWYDYNVIADDSRPSLTMAAALHLEQFQPVAHGLLRLVGYFIKRQMTAPTSPDSVRRNFVEAYEVREILPDVTPEFVRAVPRLLQHEPLLSRGVQGYYSKPDGSESWRYELTRNVLRFKDVGANLWKYVERQVEEAEQEERENKRRFSISGSGVQINTRQFRLAETVAAPAELPPTVTPVSTLPTYVNPTVRAELEAKRGKAAWNLDKLLQLLTELDESYGANQPYSCHALLRAIIDHVPPILGLKSFEQAVSNYQWTPTDKKYMKRLLEFKNQADDVMHRHISKRPSVITMHDVPAAAYLNALLAECLDKL